MEKGFEKLKQVKTGMIIACAAGHNADTSILKQITEVVVELATADTNTIKAFSNGFLQVFLLVVKSRCGQKEVNGLNDLPTST